MNTEYIQSTKRRGAPRFPVIAPIEVHIDRGGIVTGTLVNLSLTGAFCLLDGNVPELSSVLLRVELPVTMPDTGTVETPVIDIQALVVRTEETDRRLACALMFGEMPLESEWVIGRHILETFDGVTQSSLRQSETDPSLHR